MEHDAEYFWATHQGAETDLLFQMGNRMSVVETRRRDAPRITPSTRKAMEDLKLNRVVIVYAGNKRFPLIPRVEVLPFKDIRYGLGLI